MKYLSARLLFIAASLERGHIPIRHSLRMIFACGVLAVPADLLAAQLPPVPSSPLRAQLPLGSNLRKRCADLRIADAGAQAVVVFWLPRSGAPSEVSIKSSSGSEALDSAAVSCASKLRFPPATTLGDGQAIDSWQQIAFTWADQAGDVRAATPKSSSTEPGRTSGPLAGAPPRAAEEPGGVVVRVCVDESGKLQQGPTIVRSSGRELLDQAAVQIAASGSAYYRPDAAPSESAASGCAQLSIKFNVK